MNKIAFLEVKYFRFEAELNVVGLTSTSSTLVSSGISRNITVHRVWLGRTFKPSASTWTLGDSVEEIGALSK